MCSAETVGKTKVGQKKAIHLYTQSWTAYSSVLVSLLKIIGFD